MKVKSNRFLNGKKGRKEGERGGRGERERNQRKGEEMNGEEKAKIKKQLGAV